MIAGLPYGAWMLLGLAVGLGSGIKLLHHRRRLRRHGGPAVGTNRR